MTTDPLDALTSALPPASWSRDPDEIAPHARDWRGRFIGSAPLLLKPASTAEVVRILDICHARRIAVLPQGGNTGLVGGSTPLGEVVISMKRMNAVRAVDPGQ